MDDLEIGCAAKGHGRFTIIARPQPGQELHAPDDGDDHNGYDKAGLIKVLHEKFQQNFDSIARLVAAAEAKYPPGTDANV